MGGSAKQVILAEHRLAKRRALFVDDTNDDEAERRILVVDDDQDFADSLIDILKTQGYVTQKAGDKKAALSAVAEFWPHVALLDVKLGKTSGIDLLSSIRSLSPDTLCVMMTAYRSMDTVLAALKLGAYDYLSKPVHSEEMLVTLDRCFERQDFKRQQLASEHALRNSEERNRLLLDSTAEAIYGVDLNGNCTFVNPSCLRMLGYDKEQDLLGKNMPELTHYTRSDGSFNPKQECRIDQAFLEGKAIHVEDEVLWRDDGSSFPVEYWSHPIYKDEQVVGSVVTFMDISERKQTDEMMKNIAIGVSAQLGEAFFQSLTIHLAKIFNVEYVLIGLLDQHDKNKITTVAASVDGKTAENFSYDLKDTPCSHVVNGTDESIRSYPSGIQKSFPDDHMLLEMAAESYVGAPLVNTAGKHIGLIAVIGKKPMETIKQVESILQIFAVRTVAEMERLKSEEISQLNTQHLLDAQRISHIGNWELDLNSRELNWSDEIYRIFEMDKEKVGATYETFLDAIHPDDRERVNTAYTESVKNKESYIIEHRLRMTDGRIKTVREQCKTIYDEAGNPTISTGTVQDITEQVSMEEGLRRTQKMDALGKLTGGIAHDYNNMLGVIMGYSELLQTSLSEQPDLVQYVDEIFHAAERGSRLTNKLLGFSRQKSMEVDCLNINSLLLNQQHMLEKTLTVRVKLILDLTKDLWSVWVDGSEMEDTILNLSINAMHAMEDKGQLTIHTSNEYLDHQDAQTLGLSSGDYVLLSITDTGCGMDETTKEKIFEPFFSTKGEKGTGLGLSQVYGFVRRSLGEIKVYSELNHGTRFALYFPRYNQNTDEEQRADKSNMAAIKGSETILLVDDEAALLKLNHEILTNHGFKVIPAESAEKALEILEHKTVDVLISDIIMPGMDGYQLAAIVKEKYPDIKIQLASGFTDNRNMDMVDESLQQNLLSKPFNSQTLLQRIHVLLNE